MLTPNTRCVGYLKFRPGGGVNDVPVEVSLSCKDTLLRHTSHRWKHCPQTLVPLHNISDRRAQRTDIQRTGNLNQ